MIGDLAGRLFAALQRRLFVCDSLVEEGAWAITDVLRIEPFGTETYYVPASPDGRIAVNFAADHACLIRVLPLSVWNRVVDPDSASGVFAEEGCRLAVEIMPPDSDQGDHMLLVRNPSSRWVSALVRISTGGPLDKDVEVFSPSDEPELADPRSRVSTAAPDAVGGYDL